MKKYDITPESIAQHLSGVTQFPTLSHDIEAKIDFDVFFKMHDYLEQIYPNVHATLEKEVIGKAALLYKWKGTGKSNAKPMLFMAHQDVVPEGDHSQWKYPPYSGAIAEGMVWGRGSGDCKSHMIAQLDTIEHLIGEGFQPDYDIYLAYGYNEEVAGGDSISAALLAAQTLQERGVRLGVSLDEGGGMRSGAKMGIGVDVCAISVAEKGYADFEIIRTDPGGHSSRPRKGGALDYVAQAILAIRDNQFPYRITETVKRRYETLAPYMMEKDPALAALLTDVEGNWDKLLPIIDNDPGMAAMFHTTMVPTMAQGSSQGNILPEKASVTVNCRLLEGDTLESVRAHIESIIPEGMTVRLIKGNDPSPASSVDSDAGRLIHQICRELHGEDVILLPDVTAGGTDAKFMYGVCDNVYRFGSFFRKKGEGNAHAVNETVDIEALYQGPAFYEQLIRRYGK